MGTKKDNEISELAWKKKGIMLLTINSSLWLVYF